MYKILLIDKNRAGTSLRKTISSILIQCYCFIMGCRFLGWNRAHWTCYVDVINSKDFAIWEHTNDMDHNSLVYFLVIIQSNKSHLNYSILEAIKIWIRLDKMSNEESRRIWFERNFVNLVVLWLGLAWW